jgi:hypothetical protein
MITLRNILPLALLTVCCLQVSAARASGDFRCATVWALDQRTYADCDNLPLLSPGNDTPVKLQWLLLNAGRADANSDYASGEGSRCRSDGAVTQAFDAALDASPTLPAAERTALSTARGALSPTRTDNGASLAYTSPAVLRSTLGRQFGDHLAGTAAY